MGDLDVYKQEEGDRPVERSPRGRYIRFDIRLGTGAYKTVYKAYDTDQGIDVAWNAIDIGVLPSSEKTRIIQEVQLLQKLEHKNIINFYGSWFSKEKNQVVFITEIMTSGTLKSYIKRVQFVKWKIIKRWCIQILEGLHYLHSQHPPVIHRDLKCDNIFINGNTGDLRIGDLGLSTQLAVHKRSRAQSVLGTPEFMAPELYDESYDEKVDIYAFGMCVLEMVTKEVPYSECINPAQIYKKVTAGIRPRGLQRIISQAARDFIELCLSRGNGEIDVSAEYLLDHPFLKASEDDNDMVKVLDEDALERDVQPPAPPMKASSFAEELNMESGSKGRDHVTASDRRRNHPSLSLEPEELATGSASNSRAGSRVLSHSLDTSSSPPEVPAEEKSAGKHRVLLPKAFGASGDDTAVSKSARPSAAALPPLAPVAPPPAAPPPAEPVVDEPLSGKKNVDDNVEEFLSTMPGSESKIRNDRIAVMGGRGHRIEIDDTQVYSDEDDDREVIQPVSAPASIQPTPNSSEVERPASAPNSLAISDAQQDRPRASTTTDAPRLPTRPSSAPRKRGKRYEIKASKDPENEHSILLNLRIAIDGKSKEIKFPFNLFTESPHEVACELAVDVGILEPDLEDIADSISFLVTEGKINNLVEFDQDVWDEAPEPHSFSTKSLPHVSKMVFGTTRDAVSLDMDVSVHGPTRTQQLSSSSTISVPKELPRHIPSDGHNIRNEASLLMEGSLGSTTKALHTSDRSISPPRGAHMVHAASETALYTPPEDYSFSDARERGVSLGSSIDPNYSRTVRHFEDRISAARSLYDEREASLQAAILTEGEKHQREVERYQLKMQELNAKKAQATMARQERLRREDYKPDSEAVGVDRGANGTPPPIYGDGSSQPTQQRNEAS